MTKEKNNQEQAGYLIKHTAKDNLFHRIFKEPEVQLSLYNAFAGKNITDATELTTVTLENAIYISMKNDCAFIMCNYLYMVEQQSTLCGNIPLRHLLYVAEEFKSLIDKSKVHYTQKIKLNNPKFIVLYNGKDVRESKWEERLSEVYKIQGEDPSLELKVDFYNMNEGHNDELKERCAMLKEYGIFIDKIHKYQGMGHSVKVATEVAIEECISNGILKEYLEKERERVMCEILEYYTTVEENILNEARDMSEAIGEAREEIRGIQLLIQNMCSVGIVMDEAIQRASDSYGKSISEIKEIIDMKMAV